MTVHAMSKKKHDHVTLDVRDMPMFIFHLTQKHI